MTRMVVQSLLIAVWFPLFVLHGAQPAAAQTPPKQEEDPFASVLFPPELIMQHARTIRLNDEQRAAITKLIEQLQGRVIGLQWQLSEQAQGLKVTLRNTRVDQDRAIDQLNGVLETENSIKKAHLEMLLRIKNVLRAEQQRELARLRGTAADRKGLELQVEPWAVQPGTKTRSC